MGERRVRVTRDGRTVILWQCSGCDSVQESKAVARGCCSEADPPREYAGPI